MFSYGKKLKQYRQNNKLTQEETAKILGMTQSNYSRLEKGELDIKISQLLNACNKLNVSADWLLDLDTSENIVTSGPKK